MTTQGPSDWSRRIEQVIRSRHYTWLGEGLGGMPIEEAMITLTAEVMQICQREGISWEQVVKKSREQISRDEQQVLQR